jgi:hypothetical protein
VQGLIPEHFTFIDRHRSQLYQKMLVGYSSFWAKILTHALWHFFVLGWLLVAGMPN